MGFAPGHAHDVFISYAHVDNDPIYDNSEGWVTKFEASLAKVLRRRLGRAPDLSIWRDQKLRGNDYFDDAIATAVRSGAVFVTVLSPGYLASPYCGRELEEFCREGRHELDGPHGRQSRVFNVMIAEVPYGDWPRPLQGLTSYRFFSVDPETDTETLFRRTREDDPDQKYWKALDGLGQDIAEILIDLAGRAAAARAPARLLQGAPAELRRGNAAPAAEPCIYLAEVTDDLEEYREEIRRALVQQGVRVLPERPLPRTQPELTHAIRSELEAAVLSVHLVGALYGKAVEGTGRSHSQLQSDLAGETAERRDLPRLVWVARDLDLGRVRDERQRTFLGQLEAAPDPGARTEVLKIGLEELKDTLLRRLLPPRAPRPALNALIYLACRPEDGAHAEALTHILHARRHDVILSAHGGDEETLRKHHRANLRASDVIVVVYGGAPAVWVREQVVEARRLKRRRRFGIAICEAPPRDKADLGLAMVDLVTVNCRAGITATDVAPLLALAEERLP